MVKSQFSPISPNPQATFRRSSDAGRVEANLKQLQTDYIGLCWVHILQDLPHRRARPDR
jgi:hypothetical protein